MSRVIRFRAWDNFSKLMSFFGLKDYSKIESMISYTGDFYTKLRIMQFTGLLDKNKQEIWEGDIVRHWCCTQKSFNREVIFQWGMFGFLDGIKQFNPIGTSLGNKPDNTGYVVIGDIYQNPELLESNR